MPDSSSDLPPPKKQRTDSNENSAPGGALAVIPEKVPRPHAFQNDGIEIFEQVFTLQMNNVDWVNVMGTTTDSDYLFTQPPYFYLPLDRLFMYMNPLEYQNLVAYKRWAVIKDCAATVTLLSYRQFFETSTTETQVASPSTIQHIDCFLNYKNLHPYIVYNNSDDSPTALGNPVDYASNTHREAILAQLYGNNRQVHKAGWKPGACDKSVYHHYRPTFWTNTNRPNQLSQFISGFNMIKHTDVSWTSQDLGASIQYKYKPHNGLISVQGSAVDAYPPSVQILHTGLTTTLAKTDRILQTADLGNNGIISATPAASGGIISIGQKGQATIQGYMRSIENVNEQILGGEKDIRTPPDFFLGARSAPQPDDTFVKGIMEIQVATRMVVHTQMGTPMAYAIDPAVIGSDFAGLLAVPQRSTFDEYAVFKTGLQKDNIVYLEGGVGACEKANPPPSFRGLNITDFDESN